ncbi:MAG: hypothetical protein IT306_08210 [Chloroflexi bacterium]|nr:hypothetical protein [Chloroflexota bacterium]
MADDLLNDGEDWDAPRPYPRPIGLEGARWTVSVFHELGDLLPEKMELIDGKLFWSRRERIGMLAAMLEQVGLVDAVRLAPKELWLEALRRVEAEEQGG